MRRIDDLGRIVVPKEIRRVLRIREGDPLEIFTNREGEILLKKYSPVGELKDIAKHCAESLAETTGELVCITDKDYVVAASGPKKKEYDGKPLTKDLEKIIEKRMVYHAQADEKNYIRITPEGGEEFAVEAIAPILCSGDSIGAVVLFGKDMEKWQTETAKKLVKMVASFIGRQMEN